MNNTYKDQFTEWSPAYPVVFHNMNWELYSEMFEKLRSVRDESINTNNITINAINKAMKK
tara:strand:- start:13766 stop:13945 length:180 start_codon:yes stop_codon:yes gene_type:complete